jgi:hypothetical protein
MIGYQISQGGEPVALVATIALARQIVQCQPDGFYQVDAVEVGEPVLRRRLRSREPSIRRMVRRSRHEVKGQPSPGVSGLTSQAMDQAQRQVH